jgi:unsaturated rhamnogalacturonyl hydrolase
LIITGLAGACLNPPTAGQDGPDLWSLRMAEAVMNRFDSLIYYNHTDKVKWQYDIAMLGQAIDKLGSVDEKFSLYMQDFTDYFVREDGSIRGYRKSDYNLDHINPAKNLLTLYKRTGERKYLDAIQHFVRQLEEQPVTSAEGFWHKKRYPTQMWLDGVYMSSPFMAQYAKEFDQPQWFNTVARQITLIYEKTLDEESGLLYHAWDESKQQQWADPASGCSPNFWGRAMGWYMMALVDVLDYFPPDHPGREEILAILNQLAEALLRVRDPDTGLWYQVLDQDGREGNYLEASCSSMFTYAFAKGAKKGYLPEDFGSIAAASFESILREFVIIDEDGMVSLTKICGAAGLGGDPYRDGSYEYYIHEKIVKNDPKGVGPFILAAIELKR